MINDDPNVSRVLDALLNLFLSNNKGYTKTSDSTNPAKLTKDEKRVKRFFKDTAKSVQRNGLLLQYVATEYKIPELCALAVKQNGNALQFVPENLRTPALCLKAIKKKPEAIHYVPENLKTVCQTQLELQRYTKKNRFSWFKKPFQIFKNQFLSSTNTKSDILIRVLNILENIDTGEKSKQELKDELLEYFKELPDGMKNYDLCKKVADYNIKALPYIPQSFKVEEICKKAVSKSYQALEYIPEISKDIETCLIAYLKSSKALDFIPVHSKKEVVEKSLLYKKALGNIKTKADLEAFIHQWGKITEYVQPHDFVSSQIRKIISVEKSSVQKTEIPPETKKTIQENLNGYLGNLPEITQQSALSITPRN